MLRSYRPQKGSASPVSSPNLRMSVLGTYRYAHTVCCRRRVVSDCSYCWCWYCSCGVFTAVPPSINQPLPWVPTVDGDSWPHRGSRVTTHRVTTHPKTGFFLARGRIAPYRAISKRYGICVNQLQGKAGAYYHINRISPALEVPPHFLSSAPNHDQTLNTTKVAKRGHIP